jgi:hypothetical protein
VAAVPPAATGEPGADENDAGPDPSGADEDADVVGADPAAPVRPTSAAAGVLKKPTTTTRATAGKTTTPKVVVPRTPSTGRP